MRVDFMIVGAMKCGTSSLARALAAHPGVCFSRPKEPQFFNRVTAWRQALPRYHALFAPRPGQLLGEGSVQYTWFPEYLGTPQRLHEYNPALRLIYLMRHPVERVVSHYAHELVRGRVKGPPEAVVLRDPAYVNRSRYAVQIRPYLERFPREQVLLLVFEEMVAAPRETLETVLRFLGLPPDPPEAVELPWRHPSAGAWYYKQWFRALGTLPIVRRARTHLPRALRSRLRSVVKRRLPARPTFSPPLRRALWALLEDDVREMEAILGRPVGAWERPEADLRPPARRFVAVP